ncbi:hypothetical protein H6F43_16140 [Leptolyngbya sp. FACHB-36]|uniref:hypothetical protein n=1 Tax=Leptolyngbya sp. FACHB-36 TaxID=2692808 RepID=UPI0016816688|nr:hypothetical protein [Leptolyngbya sp. FACHB-36]MBD2021711.1 hypothetical protein [Leptolyngbya sp. FACHB-36]
MRVPMDIARTDQVYQAMWSMLLAVRQHNRFQSRRICRIACPGLGTATGQMPYAEAARQMSLRTGTSPRPPRFCKTSEV